MSGWHLRHQQWGGVPWAVQSEALRRAAGRDRYGYWLECGLGKTALVLNEFIDRDDVDCLVVIAPNSFCEDWRLAAAEWGVGFIAAGSWPRRDPVPDAGSGPALYVFNYEAVRWSRRGERGFAAAQQLLRRRRCLLVIDESKAVGNPTSFTTKGVLELVKDARLVRALNGTPMTESVMDYWGQLRVLGELEGCNPVAFRSRYAVRGGYMGKQILRGEAGINPERAAELGQVLERCSFRALKADWRKDLPPQISKILPVEMTDNQIRHYQTMMEEFYAEVTDEGLVTAEIVLTQLDKLRQISSCLLLDGKARYQIEAPADNPKIQAVLEVVRSGLDKAIIVYFYQESGNALFEICRQAGLDPARIAGGMTPAAVRAEKDRFNNDPACRVLIGQQVATARGHTLVGSAGDRCSRILFYENHFGLYWREQIKDRNHRGDQDQTCWLYDFVSSPVERVVVEGLQLKKSAADLMDRIVAAVRDSYEEEAR
jgi:hypothetical protein